MEQAPVQFDRDARVALLNLFPLCRSWSMILDILDLFFDSAFSTSGQELSISTQLVIRPGNRSMIALPAFDVTYVPMALGKT